MKVLAITVFASCMFAAKAVSMLDAPAILFNCGRINGLDAPTVKDIAILGTHLTNPEKNIVKHVICCFKDTEVLTSTGVWNVDNIRAILLSYITETEMKKVVDCAVNKNTEEETAFGFWRCAYQIVGRVIPFGSV